MNKILVVDDQQGICYSFKRILGRHGYDVFTAPDGEEAIHRAKGEKPDLVIMDIMMPGMDGLETMRGLKSLYPGLSVIIMTAFSSAEKAITAMKDGAYDYLTKPVDNATLISLVERAINAGMMSKPVTFEEKSDADDRIVGRGPAMLEIYKRIGQIAGSDVTVLISGETGTGKELVARAIYHHSKRVNRPFLPVNCAAIPETLLESELFGHEKGAFTGADSRKIGKFEQCDTGTMFLDEIGDMPLSIQSKVLRVLEDRSFQRLGGKDVIHADVRILAATNKDLESLMNTGKFRNDLYWRLNVVNISLPPLRERKEDINDLVQYFIRKYNMETGKTVRGVSPEVLEEFVRYDWPGNVRELQSIIHRGMILCAKDMLSFENCGWLPHIKAFDRNAADTSGALSGIVNEILQAGGTDIYRNAVSSFEHLMVRRALELTGNNQVMAAKLLGISRNTLREKLGKNPS